MPWVVPATAVAASLASVAGTIHGMTRKPKMPSQGLLGGASIGGDISNMNQPPPAPNLPQLTAPQQPFQQNQFGGMSYGQQLGMDPNLLNALQGLRG